MQRPIPFGKYILLERISVGGMAEVFKAKSFGVKGFEKIIAIKKILPHLAEDEHFVEMFIAEAKMAVQLNHASICQIYDLGRIGEHDHYIAMEYISGRDLLSLHNFFRRKQSRMPMILASYIGARVAEGLDYAHRKRGPDGDAMHIVHRDVSPQNVIISYDGQVKLIDFGIAKARSRNMQETQAGVLKGKFGYMSPEQVQGRPIDHRSDIFALGTVVHETLTCQRLFFGESDFATLELIRDGQVAPPSRVNPDVPAELDRIVMKALAKDLDERYGSAAEMGEDLSRFIQGRGHPYSGKALSDWMVGHFTDEIEKERSKNEAYARITEYPQAASAPLLDPTEDEETSLWTPDEDEDPPDIKLERPTWVQSDEDELDPGLAIAGTQIRDDEGSELDLIDVTADDERVTPVPQARPIAPVAPSRRHTIVYWAVVGSLMIAAIGGGVFAYRAIEPAPIAQPAGLVLRVSPPDNLSIYVDNQRVYDRSPYSRKDMPPAAYSLRIERQGHETWRQTVTLNPGEIPEIPVKLVPVKAEEAKVRFVTTPPEAAVYIDGRILAADRRHGYVLLPGGRPVDLEVRMEGHLTYHETFIPGAGASQTRRIELVAAGGSLYIDSEPRGDVILNGRRLGRAPRSVESLDIRRSWTLRIEHPGYRPHEQAVAFGNQKYLKIKPALVPIDAIEPP